MMSVDSIGEESQIKPPGRKMKVIMGSSPDSPRNIRAGVRGGDRVRKKTTRGRHVTKVRAINLDSATAPVSEEEMIDEEWSTPIPAESSSTRNTSEGRRRRSSISGENVSVSEADVLDRIPSPTKLKKLEGTQLSSLAGGLLEEVRTKSTRIQGRLSGRLRDCVTSARLIIQTLVDRLENRGDTTYIKLQNIDLTAQIRAANRKKEERAKEIAILETEIRTLRASMSDSRKVVVVEETRPARPGQTDTDGRAVIKHTVEEWNQSSTSRIKTKTRPKKREILIASHTSEENQFTEIGSAEPAVKAISLIDKRIQDLMLVRNAQIRSDGSIVSAAVIGSPSEVTDGQASVPRRKRGRMKDIKTYSSIV